jgi:ubiquinone/menaquinone biosynthesis C-methylase UbiE
MDSIADSSAFRDDDRMLPQHQAALTLLQGLLSDPAVKELLWLDLACGRGQILTGISSGLSQAARSKVEYVGYDMSHRHAQETDRLASGLGFRTHSVKVGYLSDFPKLLSTGTRFNFITLTNTIHEVRPGQVGSVLVEAVARLASDGCLFVYDMETIHPPELGAVPWTASEMTEILTSLLSALGIAQYEPAVGTWRHRTCDAWNVQIYREHLGISDATLDSNRAAALAAATQRIAALLEARLERCSQALDNLTRYGTETAEEQTEKERLLYEFWAVNRALEGTE